MGYTSFKNAGSCLVVFWLMLLTATVAAGPMILESQRIPNHDVETFPLVKRSGCRLRADILGCPGQQVQYNFPGAPPSTNGCGPETTNPFQAFFNKIIDQPWASPCCQDHDRCYGSCTAE